MDRGTAESVVAENLGLDLTELGGDDPPDDEDEPDLGDGDDVGRDQFVDDGEDDDEPDPNDPFDPSVVRRQQEPTDRVSHTRRGQEQQPPKRPLPRRSEVTSDKKGNLVDKNGQIVARAGREARIYQGRERARRELSRAQSEATQVRDQLRKLAGATRQLHTQLEAHKAADSKLKELGISPQEQLTAMQLFVELRDNPANGIKRIMARAAAQGVDLTQLGQNGNVGFDAKTIAELIKGEVSKVVEPLKARSDEQAERDRQQQEERRRQEDAAAEVQDFFKRNPEAVPYAPVFSRVLANPAFANLSLGEIYARILQHPNLARSGTQDRRQRSRTPNGMPRGRGAAPSGNSKIADPNTSYESILNTVLDEVGVSRNQRV